MNSWADESDDLQPAPTSYTGERPKLNLKPRSQAAASTSSATTSKSSIFGAAKPREEVLQSKGIDVKEVEKRVEKKASVVRFTAEQNKQVESLRAELTSIEEKLREANENELPEEEYRVAAEEKRSELNALMKEFAELNVKEGAKVEKEDGGGESGSRGQPRKFERPSERRRRLEQQRREEGGHGGGGGRGGYHHGGGGHRYNDYDNSGEDAYASFGGGRDRRGSGRGESGRGRGGGYNRDGYNDRGEYNDRGSRGSYSNRGGGRSYNDDEGGGRRYNDDKYAGDRYNY